jgi:DNA-binding beta-propeller fold protein YncE
MQAMTRIGTAAVAAVAVLAGTGGSASAFGGGSGHAVFVQTDNTTGNQVVAYDREDGLLYAVNAASNTISVFAVFGDRLALRQVLSSGGSFPVSVAVGRGLVYVLNAEEGGSVQGYVVASGRLVPIPGSNRALGLNPTETPQFTHTPGQVAFSPDGSQLLVTTKANGSDIDAVAAQDRACLSADGRVDHRLSRRRAVAITAPAFRGTSRVL